MKKYVALALCLGAVATMGAQKTAVDAAKKLSGKVDQISEARTLIQGAMQDPSTAKDANTYFIAGKIEFDAFDKANTKAQTDKNYKADQNAMGQQLLNGYNYFMQAMSLDNQPDANGKVKPKYTGKIVSTFSARVGDYWNSGAYYYNAKDYKNAYQAFYDCGDIASNIPTTMNDSTIAMAFKNAGLMAYSANEVDKAAEAFKRARLTKAADSETFTYEIAAWQAKAQQDSTATKAAEDAIYEVANEGLRIYGTSPLFFLNNIVSYKVSNNQFDEAIAMVTEQIQKDPQNGNLYGLMAFVDDRAGKKEAAEANYRKALETANTDFDILKNAAIFLYKEGTEALNKIDGNSADARAQKAAVKENYFMKASEAAQKAQKLNPKDSRLNSIIDNIDYAITTYF